MTIYSQLRNDFEKEIFGYSAIAIIISTCVGSIAAMTSLMHGNGLLPMFFVFLSVVVCNAHNAAILTVQKPKLVFDLLIVSVVVNLLLIIGNSLY